MPRRMIKDAVPTGLSISRDLYTAIHDYHSKLASVYIRRTGKVPSFSDTIELLIRTGFAVLKELDFDDVIDELKERGIPKTVSEYIRTRKASVLGGLTDAEIEDLLKKAKRMK